MRAVFRVGVTIGLAIAMLRGWTPAHGAMTFTVNDTADVGDAIPGDGSCATAGGVCTLRAAVQEANALPGRDEIDLDTAIYVLSAGKLDVTDDLWIFGKAEAATVVDGSGQTILDIGDLVTTIEVRDITLRNGADGILVDRPLDDPSSAVAIRLLRTSVIDSGGTCINISFGGFDSGQFDTSLSLEDSTVKGCGTGVVIDYARAAVTRSRIDGNANAGVYCAHVCVLSLSRTVLSRNGTGLEAQLVPTVVSVTASDISRNGTGITFHGSELLLEGTMVRKNTGDGIYLGGNPFGEDALANLANSSVTDNGGAGIAGADNVSSASLTGSVVSGNGGAGIVVSRHLTLVSSTVSFNAGNGVANSNTCFGVSRNRIINSTISNNGGDGIVQDSCDPTFIRNATIANNGGRGVVVDGDENFIGNTIVSGHFQGDCAGTLTSEGHNLIQDASGCSVVGDPSTNLSGDPRLAPLTSRPGELPTRPLLPDSAAIDAGSPAAPGAAGACEIDDQRGVSRPQGTTCDIGAYELTCGNGEVDAGEDCDDGGRTSCDGCSGTCRAEGCGNGIVECAERCDAGPQNGQAGSGCSAECASTRCDLDVDGIGSLNVGSDITYIARYFLGLTPVPPSFRDTDPNIPPNESIAAKIDALCPQHPPAASSP